PFSQCPAVGTDTSCEFLLVVTSSGAVQVFHDSTQPPVDGIEDTLVGVVNSSGSTINSLALSSSSDIFGFDGDGLCTLSGHPGGCPFGSTGYEGPNTSFSGINAAKTGGVVNFTGGLTNNATAYFSLEEALSTATLFGSPPTRAEQGGAANP